MKWLAGGAILAMLALLTRPGVLPAALSLPAVAAQDSWKLELAQRATTSIGYVAEADRWLVFPLPPAAPRIRIVSNGNLRDVSGAAAVGARDFLQRWHYALEIEMLDRAGHVVLRHVHHYRANVTEISTPDGKVLPASYYLDERLIPTTGDSTTLEVGAFAPPLRLRVRAAGIDRELADALVRVYVPEVSRGRDVLRRWQRLSDAGRSALAKGSVYGAELLSENEKRNLLGISWHAAAPQGVAGIDFLKRRLYVVHDIPGELVGDPVPPAGIFTARGHLAVFPLPEEGGELMVQARPITPVSPDGMRAAVPAEIHGRWYGKNVFARKEITLRQLNAGSDFSTGALPGGQIELEAPYPMALRAFMRVGGERIEITPQPLYQRLFAATQDKPVIFSIAHAARRPTPIRLGVRYLYPAAGVSVLRSVIRYEFLDDAGVAVKAGEISLSNPPSRYDQAMGQPVETRIADPAEYFFGVPPEANQIRLSVGGGRGETLPTPLVVLYTRPADLIHEVRAPEDEFEFSALGPRQRVWFPVRPLDYDTLVRDNRLQLISLQSRPPEDKPEYLTGQFTWKDFLPRADASLQQLMVPREPGAPWREEMLASTYQPLVNGGPQTLTFPAWLGVRQLTPRIIWEGLDDARFTARLVIDGRQHHVFAGRGPYGETALPPVAAGPHVVTLEVNAAVAPHFYLNHVRPDDSARVRRVAARLAQEVSFDIVRSSPREEVVTARLFQPADWRGRTILRARVTGPPAPVLAPMQGWVLGERRFDVRPDFSFAAPVFDTHGRRTDAGRPVFLPFPADAPLGHYRISFRIEDGPAGWLTVSRMTPGMSVQRRVLNEPEVAHDAATEP